MSYFSNTDKIEKYFDRTLNFLMALMKKRIHYKIFKKSFWNEIQKL